MNTELTEEFCETKECDLICQDTFTCEDESFCNGFRYGMECNQNHYNDLLINTPPYKVCDNTRTCVNGEDEQGCEVNNDTISTCNHYSGNIIPLFNYTRCGPRVGYSQNSLSFDKVILMFCNDFLDQTNCSDYSRVGLHCSVGGHMSTVANQIVCMDTKYYFSELYQNIPQICDDGLDKLCVNASLSCLVHKQQLCDGQVDCEDESDETQEICGDMVDTKCVRRYVFDRSRQNKTFPLAWVKDGIYDCWDGEDEMDSWPTCGFGPNTRFRGRLNDSCSEVFLCYGSEQFIDFTTLCDKINSCDKENNLCEISRAQAATSHKVLRDSVGTVTLSYCLRGLDDIRHLTQNICKEVKFRTSARNVFGKNSSHVIQVPSSKIDCRNFYGESYVFLSCLGHCIDSSSCPLDTGHIAFDSCPGQFTRNRVFTVDNDGNLTFLIKNHKSGTLGDDVFICANHRTCLTFDKVCNLVDDCDDGSDEVLCDNHFQCETSGEYLPVTQKCDQVIHCKDGSDECNETCGQNILNLNIFKVSAWIIGILSIFLNCRALITNSTTLHKSKSEAAFLTSSLIILISFGDFLIGIYLTALASFDSYHGAGHCKEQLHWITSRACIFLGVINTVGSQVSLFSMTSLSVIRVVGICKSGTSVPKEITKKRVLKAIIIVLVIVLLSILASYLPLHKPLEDFFVNGIKYDDSNTLFMGCPNKKMHVTILQEYYGRMQFPEDLSWSLIQDLVAGMFSADYGGITPKTLTFYGNDPVCVFKYFVRMDDPQRNFSLIILSTNLCCIAAITASYGIIAASSKKSIGALTQQGLNASIQQANDRLQRVVHAIIISDFLCWMPFIVTSWLHLFDVVDATPWYPTFSIIILPLNSVINPLLYDTVITGALHAVFEKCTPKCLDKLNVIRNVFVDQRALDQVEIPLPAGCGTGPAQLPE